MRTREEPGHPMTTQELLAKLKPLEADRHCSVCGDTDWEPYGEAVFVLPKADHGVVINEGIPCVALFCRVCGNARFHSTEVLETAKVLASDEASQ
jgi:hypothetical protein